MANRRFNSGRALDRYRISICYLRSAICRSSILFLPQIVALDMIFGKSPHFQYDQPRNCFPKRKGSDSFASIQSLSAPDRIAGISPASDRSSDFDPWSAWRDFCGFHEFFDRLFYWWASVGRHSRKCRNAAVRAGREAWRQLHADDGCFGRRHVRARCIDSGDDLAWSARTTGLAAGSVLYLYWHVRSRYRHVLYADPRRSHAVALSVGLRGGEHPAGAHGQGPAQALCRQAGGRDGNRVSRWTVLAEHSLVCPFWSFQRDAG